MLISPLIASISMVPSPAVSISPSAFWVTVSAAITETFPVPEQTRAFRVTSLPSPSASSRMLPLPCALVSSATVKEPLIVLITIGPLPAPVTAPLPPLPTIRASASWTKIPPLVLLVATRIAMFVSMSSDEVPMPCFALSVTVGVDPVRFASSSPAVSPSVMAPSVAITSIVPSATRMLSITLFPAVYVIAPRAVPVTELEKVPSPIVMSAPASSVISAPEELMFAF